MNNLQQYIQNLENINVSFDSEQMWYMFFGMLAVLILFSLIFCLMFRITNTISK